MNRHRKKVSSYSLLKHQIKQDLYQGISMEYIKFFIGIIFVSVITYVFVNRVYNFYLIGKISENSYSIGDVLLYWFKGMKEYNPSGKIAFDMPIQYVFLNVYLAFIIGNYPVKNLLGFGKNVLVRTKNRKLWWFSKCIWNVMTVLVFYGVLYVIIFIACMLHGNITLMPTLDVSKIATAVNLLSEEFTVDMGKLLLSMVLLPICTSIALSMFQMMLAFFTSPTLSYIAIIAIMISSAFYKSQFLVGNYFMMKRNSCLENGGIDTATALLLDAIIFIVSAVGGYIYFRKYDVVESNKMF